jgi:hypothetical protein
MQANEIRVLDYVLAGMKRGHEMTDAERLLAGPKMFEEACEIAKAEILRAHPDFTEQQVLDELRRRVRAEVDERNRPTIEE